MAKKGSKFKKYSLEFKLQVVQDYLSNKYGGVDAITKKHGLKSSRQVRDWLKLYEENPALLGKISEERNLQVVLKASNLTR